LVDALPQDATVVFHESVEAIADDGAVSSSSA
jgi:hypothetical protein